jgi:hypothetical protein
MKRKYCVFMPMSRITGSSPGLQSRFVHIRRRPCVTPSPKAICFNHPTDKIDSLNLTTAFDDKEGNCCDEMKCRKSAEREHQLYTILTLHRLQIAQKFRLMIIYLYICLVKVENCIRRHLMIVP